MPRKILTATAGPGALTIVASVSGGKDSTATALLAMEDPRGARRRFVFADTGNEHEATYEYINEYLPRALGITIDTVRNDFTRLLEGKRRFVIDKWPAHGVPQEIIDRTLAVLHPTGVPFLDLCLWKGRFPSRMAQFCTQELKRYPIEAYLFECLKVGPVESWQGVRRDESPGRRNALELEPMAEGWTIRRPIVEWTADQTVAFVLDHGIELNPLYKQGMPRVGCMPCINCRKDELAAIATRFPHHIDRIREWEDLVCQAAKRGLTSFFTDSENPGEEETAADVFERLRIDSRVLWAKTDHGGRQFNLLDLEPPPECSSVYGLCE